ncbi:hypothetical protein NEAUS04_2297 [Nematocida ausubeli]|uniref:Uncharacterized protein n=1 Tax=Nematocida ausubeli (strain ATCC PRA-371 / ERTm2) TaxID=1913371 RepID=A0A086J462_NEMA1|nr:uncharacterized protein NESG_01086 [Nematocida ausubeli]KAI5139066.1 hypothetical protein NEAUS07_2589 [Nematocida ausubeli]KAI5151778.1 hypothetical protein NEAUS05_2592 [Nematocida ausubeli]KAI5164565.1 hypothetical protein NEAUS04_2297 [Nematocida ausubeli]KFG26930.1 hypothetical protein NESG_01086 [Nematocida ausubeli]
MSIELTENMAFWQHLNIRGIVLSIICMIAVYKLVACLQRKGNQENPVIPTAMKANTGTESAEATTAKKAEKQWAGPKYPCALDKHQEKINTLVTRVDTTGKARCAFASVYTEVFNVAKVMDYQIDKFLAKLAQIDTLFEVQGCEQGNSTKKHTRLREGINSEYDRKIRKIETMRIEEEKLLEEIESAHTERNKQRVIMCEEGNKILLSTGHFINYLVHGLMFQSKRYTELKAELACLHARFSRVFVLCEAKWLEKEHYSEQGSVNISGQLDQALHESFEIIDEVERDFDDLRKFYLCEKEKMFSIIDKMYEYVNYSLSNSVREQIRFQIGCMHRICTGFSKFKPKTQVSYQQSEYARPYASRVRDHYTPLNKT